MKVAAIQMVSTSDVAQNLHAAGALIARAAEGGAQLVLLPEYFCLMGLRDDDKLRVAEAPWDDSRAGDGDGHQPIQHFLSDSARRHGLWLIGGTLPLRTTDPARVLNACCSFAPDGKALVRYDKMHLFAYDNGSEHYDEGRTLQAGTALVALQAGALRVGLSICYDLRFPELYRALMWPPCDLLVVPAAFTYTTGRAHWDLLLRARAVENQCYVLAAAQGGRHTNGRRTWGHSQLIDPWGEVLALQEEGEGVVAGEVDAARLAEVRLQLPALAHRRAPTTQIGQRW